MRLILTCFRGNVLAHSPGNIDGVEGYAYQVIHPVRVFGLLALVFFSGCVCVTASGAITSEVCLESYQKQLLADAADVCGH
jgi:hypothetical protein